MSPDPILLTGVGAVAAVFFATWGSAAASLPSGIFAVRGTGILSFAPIVIAGVLSIYGLIVAYVLSQKMTAADLSVADGYKNLCAGLIVGLACWASGSFLGMFVDQSLYDDDNNGPESHYQSIDVLQPLVGSSNSNHRGGRRLRLQIPSPNLRFLAVLVFMEALGLYGIIIALVIIN